MDEIKDLFGDKDIEATYQAALAVPLADKIQKAIALIQEFEPMALHLSDEGYYVAFSGGKDSIVMARLFEMAGVKYQLWYNNVTIDPPELVWFIKREYPQARWNNPEEHLIKGMVDKPKGPPTRLVRWCCEKYKEQGGNGEFKAIGVRAEESPRRKGMWQTIITTSLSPILSPILYWTDADVWAFINNNKMPYCSLYDEVDEKGQRLFKRLGCVACPMSGPNGQARDFKRWPKYEAMWKDAVFAWWHQWKGVPRRDGKPRAVEKFPTPDSLWEWWISGKAYEGDDPDCQMWLW